MSKQILAAAVAATGLLLLAGVTRTLTAADDGFPPLTVKCSYTGATCDYPEGKYGVWSDCDTTYPQGMIYTRTALSICGTFTSA